eukprot:g4075.t1
MTPLRNKMTLVGASLESPTVTNKSPKRTRSKKRNTMGSSGETLGTNESQNVKQKRSKKRNTMGSGETLGTNESSQNVKQKRSKKRSTMGPGKKRESEKKSESEKTIGSRRKQVRTTRNTRQSQGRKGGMSAKQMKAARVQELWDRERGSSEVQRSLVGQFVEISYDPITDLTLGVSEWGLCFIHCLYFDFSRESEKEAELERRKLRKDTDTFEAPTSEPLSHILEMSHRFIGKVLLSDNGRGYTPDGREFCAWRKPCPETLRFQRQDLKGTHYLQSQDSQSTFGNINPRLHKLLRRSVYFACKHETLGQISRKYNVPFKLLESLNHIRYPHFATNIKANGAVHRIKIPMTSFFIPERVEIQEWKRRLHNEKKEDRAYHHSNATIAENTGGNGSTTNHQRSEGRNNEGHTSEGHNSEDHNSEGHTSEDHNNEGRKSDGHTSEDHNSEDHNSEDHNSEGLATKYSENLMKERGITKPTTGIDTKKKDNDMDSLQDMDSVQNMEIVLEKDTSISKSPTMSTSKPLPAVPLVVSATHRTTGGTKKKTKVKHKRGPSKEEKKKFLDNIALLSREDFAKLRLDLLCRQGAIEYLSRDENDDTYMFQIASVSGDERYPSNEIALRQPIKQEIDQSSTALTTPSISQSYINNTQSPINDSSSSRCSNSENHASNLEKRASNSENRALGDTPDVPLTPLRITTEDNRLDSFSPTSPLMHFPDKLRQWGVSQCLHILRMNNNNTTPHTVIKQLAGTLEKEVYLVSLRTPVTYNPSLLFVGKTFQTENDKIAYVNEMKSQKKQSAYESHLKMLYLNLKRNGELLRRVQSGEIGVHALARMKSIDLQVESERQKRDLAVKKMISRKVTKVDKYRMAAQDHLKDVRQWTSAKRF